MSLLAGNPEEREATLRHLVRRLLAEAHRSVTETARELGRPRQLLDKQLSDDGDCYLRLSDLPLLERMLPGLAAELLAPLGLRVVPGARGGDATDLVAAVGKLMGRVGAVATTTTTALADGAVDGPEALTIERECKSTLEAVGTLQASVAAAVSTTRSRR